MGLSDFLDEFSGCIRPPPKEWLWWRGSGGAFLPEDYDVMIQDGPAFVWLRLVLEDDLTIERNTPRTKVLGVKAPEPPPPPDDPLNLEVHWDIIRQGWPCEDHDWLQDEISNMGWRDIITDSHGSYAVINWALENGIAPEQPFLIRFDQPHVINYGRSYEGDYDCDVEYNFEIIKAIPLAPEECAKRWAEVADQLRCDRIEEEVRKDTVAAKYNRPIIVEELPEILRNLPSI